MQPASEEAKGFKKLPLGYWKEGNKRKRLIINDLRKTQKNFQIKFWKAEKFPTFATRYGGNDKKENRDKVREKLKWWKRIK